MFCSNCGNELVELDNFCSKCGNPINDFQKINATKQFQENGRGMLILILGVLSIIFGPFTGIPAWVMGNSDRKKINFGLIPVNHKTKTTVGMILGILGTFSLFIIFIFSIAISTGESVYKASSIEANRDAIVKDGTEIAVMAQNFYKQSEFLVGEKSFKGFQIPNEMKSTLNGKYEVSIKNKSLITIMCIGNEIGKDGISFIKALIKVEPNRIVSISTIN